MRLPAFDLVDGPVIADEETALGDVPLRRRRDEGGGGLRPLRLRDWRRMTRPSGSRWMAASSCPARSPLPVTL